MPAKLKNLGLVLLITTGGLLAGCDASIITGGDKIDVDDTANTIQKKYESREGFDLTDISCDSSDAEVGIRFTCHATNENDVGLEIEATVTSVDKDNDRVHFDWKVAEATAGPATFPDTAVKALRKIGQEVGSIECPGGTVLRKGNVIACVATMDDGSKRRAKITLKDGDGAFRVNLLGTA